MWICAYTRSENELQAVGKSYVCHANQFWKFFKLYTYVYINFRQFFLLPILICLYWIWTNARTNDCWLCWWSSSVENRKCLWLILSLTIKHFISSMYYLHILWQMHVPTWRRRITTMIEWVNRNFGSGLFFSNNTFFGLNLCKENGFCHVRHAYLYIENNFWI